MKKVFVILLLSSITLFAQGRASNLSLLIPPAYNGMGRGGVALTNHSAEAMYFNPAHLSKSAKTIAYAVDIHPGKQDWLFELSYFGSAISAGYHSQNTMAGFDRIAFGLRQYQLEAIPSASASIARLKENAIAASIGVGFTKILDFDFGFTFKRVESEFPAFSGNELLDGSATTFDSGVLVTLPLLSPNRQSLFGIISTNDKPRFHSLDVSFGYSLQNWPGTITLIDSEQSDPLPHTGRLGYAIEWTFLNDIGGEQLPIIEAAFSAEAEDLLIEEDNTDEVKTTLPFGDINPFKNVFGLQGSDKVTSHWGVRLGALDIMRFSMGGYDGAGFFDQSTWEIEFRAKGLIYFLGPNLQKDSLIRRLDFSYRFGSFLDIGDFNEGEGVGFHSLSLVLQRK